MSTKRTTSGRCPPGAEGGADNSQQRLKPLEEGYAYGLDPSLVKRRPDGLGVVYTGFLSIPVAGTYTFAVTSDDGARLYLGDKLVMDNDGQHAPAIKEGTVSLESGSQAVRILYFSSEGANQESLSMAVRSSSGDWRKVTADMLYREPENNHPTTK